MAAADATPRLRLVGASSAAIAAWAQPRRDRQAVTRENRAASENRALDPTDARWILAVRTHVQLQGSVLTPERRRRLLRTAHRLGIRPFDANVVIAVVQDHARRGLSLGEAAPTLTLIAPPRRGLPLTWLRWAAAIATATTANLLVIRWLLSA